RKKNDKLSCKKAYLKGNAEVMKVKSILSQLSKSRKYVDPVRNINSSQLEVDKWEVSDFVYKKIIPKVGVHPYPLDELMMMVSATVLIKPTHILEWGTHIGKSARVFYETITAFNIDGTVYSFDLPDDEDHIEHPREKRGALVRGLPNVKLYQEDALVKGIELYIDSDLKNKSSLFFVDGDHSYETVLNELEVIYKNVPDANVLLHDTFYQSIDSGYNTGPCQAIEKFLKESELDFRRMDTQLGLPGMTFLQPI
ncbi:MAG: class I SAM-dependent methyltransferase, partial [Cytophagales bacterium]|nr:class I SAM-dependent methyltransferase [Cytophagales bacterium]